MMNKTEYPIYRYEKKFLLKNDISEVEAAIKFHPAMFKEIFCERQVNNIYFDTIGLKNYNDNVSGISNRYKVRVRWYGNTFGKIESPILEIKIKNGQIGYKISKKMSAIIITKNTSRDDIIRFLRKFLKKANIPIKIDSMMPSTLSSYMRRYFMSFDKRFRITLDYDLSYCGIKKNTDIFNSFMVDKKNRILELKYDSEYNSDAKNITDYLNLRTSANSKYINGIDMTRL